MQTLLITCKTTKEGPFHRPEIEYLVDGYNGFILDSDPQRNPSFAGNIFEHKGKLDRLQENALLSVQKNCAIQSMIEGFRIAVNYMGKF